nr:universal stress protein [Actinomadura rugatobispora]
MGRYVLVGYDGSEESEHALRWGVEEARLRELPLEVVHAWRWPYPIDYIDYEGSATLKRVGQHLLDHGVELALRAEPTVPVSKHLMNGPAHVALNHACRDAELAVVGSHGRGELSLGSTALRLPARSTCPVVVVRNAAARNGLVVAGVDGSPGGEAALAFAFRQAALRGWSLLAVHGCWEPSAVPEADLALFSEQEKLLRMCETRLKRAVEPWRIRYPEVQAATSVPMLPPREALFEAADDADLIVVGNRGMGGFDPLLLGATSGALLQHAPCAVAIVQPEADHDR